MSRIGAGAAVTFVAAATIITASAHAPSLAQAPAAPRVTVRLDVRAEDASGRLVRDLTANDFRVFENGKRQTLSSVSARRPADRPPGPWSSTSRPGRA